LPLDLLVTELIALDDLDAAFDAMRRGDGARRVVVHGGGSRDRFVGVRQRA
jgi:Zn-dependent alcohol dehydrogenase